VLIEARWDVLPALRSKDADLGIARIPRDRDGKDAGDIVFVPLFDERCLSWPDADIRLLAPPCR
jgi:DNA-binding transcriptional LysR family regulator